MAETKYDYGQNLLSWQVPEYVKYERGRYWYLLTILAILGILAYAIFTANFFLIVIMILTIVILFVSHRQEPALIQIVITDKGLIIGQRFYPYNDINNFWLHYENTDHKALYLDFKGVIRPHLDIPLEKQDPLEVRGLLLKYLKEDLEREGEPILDSLSRFLKI